MGAPRHVLVVTTAGSEERLRERVLGVSVGLRVLFSAMDAGATSIEVSGPATDALLALAEDSRVTVPVLPYAPSGEERIVIQADALVSPALLRELNPDEALLAENGQLVAARTVFRPGSKTAAPLEGLPLLAYEPDRYHYALHLLDEDARRRAKGKILGALIKPTDGPVSRHLNRRVSLAVTRLVLPLGVTPNMMTVVVFLAGLAAGLFASSPRYVDQVLGAFLYQLHSILDGCDGELARLTRRGGRHGALLDSIVDDASNLLFWIGLSLGVSRALHAEWPVVAGAVTAVMYLGVISVQYAVALRETDSGDKHGFWTEGKRPHPIVEIVKVLLRRDAFVLICFFAVALGGAPILVALFPVAATVTLIASLGRLRTRTAGGDRSG
ncbi:MAG: CDP-alcohol phosphatidyltransferase family protein [Myxococcales bacterium]|nr:CDP-alcohol phosphatidyltransferase family protein [Myxococcales bacterium]